MHFIKKNFKKIELVLGLALFCVIGLSLLFLGILQIDTFLTNHDIGVISDLAFLMLLTLYAPNLFMYWHPILGMIINILFYIFLFFIPIFGMFTNVKNKEKRKNIILHGLFLILGIVHIILFFSLFKGFAAFMSV